jgi:hypothetical protein
VFVGKKKEKNNQAGNYGKGSFRKTKLENRCKRIEN